jgi:hypothetical protein
MLGNTTKSREFAGSVITGRNIVFNKMRGISWVIVGKPEGKDQLRDQGADGRMGSKWTLGRLVGGGGCGVDSPGSG